MLILAISLSLAGSAFAARAGDSAAAARSLSVNGIVVGGTSDLNSKGPAVIVCTAHATGQIAVTTTIQSCTATSSLGGMLKGVTPVTYAGSTAATAGAGRLALGTHYVCVSARVTYALPSQTIYKSECHTYV